MKARLLTALAVVCFSSLHAAFGATAQLEMSNDQIQMSAGPCSCGFGLTWYTHFSSFYTEDPQAADGGFVKRPAGSPTTHLAYMLYEDPSMFTSTGLAEVNLPLGDSDVNGIPDLFEDGPEIAAGTTGSFELDWRTVTLLFTWRRPAGQTIGTCDLYMNDPILGVLGPFKHTFQRTNSNGTIQYQTTPSVRSGTVSLSLSLSLNPQTQLTGPATFVRSPSEPSKNLVLKSGTWKLGDADMSFDDTLLTRDLARPSHYRGVLKFSSGEKSSHILSIVDPNDANKNGIPDLSDDVPSVLGTQRTDAGCAIIINGEVGHTYEVQTSTSLNSPSWQLFTTVTLTNAQHTVPLSAPSTGAKFWRVKKK